MEEVLEKMTMQAVQSRPQPQQMVAALGSPTYITQTYNKQEVVKDFWYRLGPWHVKMDCLQIYRYTHKKQYYKTFGSRSFQYKKPSIYCIVS